MDPNTADKTAAPAANEALLAAAAQRAAAPQPPSLDGFRAGPGLAMRRADVVQLLAQLRANVAAPGQHLDQYIIAAMKQDPQPADPVAFVDHEAVVTDWCRKNPNHAAGVVLAGIYLMSAISPVQIKAPVETAPSPN